jgi:opacity protein-like surface antigen
MKNFILSIVASACLFTHSYLQAQSCDEYAYQQCCLTHSKNIYLKVFGGANFLQTERRDNVKSTYDTGYIISGSLGYCWDYGIRVEAEYAYRRNSLDKIHFFGRNFSMHGHFQSSSYMANVLWDIPLENWGCCLWKLQPFIGGGIGYDFQQIHGKNTCMTYSIAKKGFAWQVMAGLAYPVFCNTEISLEYKFHQGGLSSIYNHSLGVGLKYHLGLNL